jgi:hypothetical protein
MPPWEFRDAGGRSAGGNGFLRGEANLDSCASPRSSPGVTFGYRLKGAPPMRVFAVQQLTFAVTAAAFLFVGAIVVGLI